MNRENNNEYVLLLAFKTIICPPFTIMSREIQEMFNKKVNVSASRIFSAPFNKKPNIYLPRGWHYWHIVSPLFQIIANIYFSWFLSFLSLCSTSNNVFWTLYRLSFKLSQTFIFPEFSHFSWCSTFIEHVLDTVYVENNLYRLILMTIFLCKKRVRDNIFAP